MNNEDTKYCKWCDISKHMYDCPFGSDGTVCPTKSVYCLFRESAEFEARVALKLAKCIDGLQNLYPPEEFPRLPYQQILKDVRLAVEEEMDDTRN